MEKSLHFKRSKYKIFKEATLCLKNREMEGLTKNTYSFTLN